MKRSIIVIVTTLALGLGIQKAQAGLFGDSEKERRIEVERQLQQLGQEKGGWQALAALLGVGALVTLIAGTVLGSRARNHAK